MADTLRRAAVAGSWYPSNPDELARQVDDYLGQAGAPLGGKPVAVIAPHAGLVYSGHVAAFAYRQLAGCDIDVAVLVGPSHFVGFEGVALYERGAFETPFGPVAIDEDCAAAVAGRSRLVVPSIRPRMRANIRSRCNCRFCDVCCRTSASCRS